MPIFLFHGDDQASSRRALNLELDKLRAQGVNVIYLDGPRLTPPELETALYTSGLFSSDALVIEGLFSRPVSRARTDCLALLAKYAGDKPLYLWEGKEVTKSTHTKALPKAQVSLSKTPAVIFQLLDSLAPGSFARSHALLKTTLALSEPGFVFIMLARRVSDLLIAKSGNPASLSPFLRSRLLSQASHWDEARLLALHHSLYQADLGVKTGSRLDYALQLDLQLSTHLR